VKVRILDTAHPDCDGPRLTQYRALFDGGKKWEALVETWLPRRSVEPPDVYAERKSLATYTNHIGPIGTMLAAQLFSEPPKLEGLPSDDWWTTWPSNVDGAGTALGSFFSERLIDLLVGRRCLVWVNLPARPEGAAYASKADEEKAGVLDAFLVGVTPEQIVDWGTDQHGAVEWVLFRDVVSERPSVEEGRVAVFRWTYLDAKRIRRWEWRPTPERSVPLPDDDAVEKLNVEHNMGRFPGVFVELLAGMWLMERSAHAVMRADRARNELTWALHQAANELLTITSKWGPDSEPKLGHGHWLKLNRDDKGEDTAAFVGPSGVAFEYLQADVEETRQDIYRVVQQLALSADASAGAVRASGDSKRQDWKAAEIILSAYATVVRDAIRSTVQVVAAARGVEVDEAAVSVSGLDGYQSEDLMTFLEAAALSVEALRMSPTFRKLVAKRQASRLLADEGSKAELKKIEGEIDAAPDDDTPYLPPPPPKGGGGDEGGGGE